MGKPLAFEVRDSAVSGRGAFAIRDIPKGERIVEYTGERITHAEADRRYDDDSMEEHHTFLFTVSGRTVIDATHGGNEARFINHSCAPNCESEIVRGRVFIFALRDILAGEELAYDYAYERNGEETEREEEQYRCLCGTSECRGSIMEPRETYERRHRQLERERAKARAQRGAVNTRTTRARETLSSSGNSRAR